MRKKSLGQHFLFDVRLLEKIVAVSGITAHDTVLEIGTGQGTLTDVLLMRAKKIITVEFDADLIPFLKEKFARPIAEKRLLLMHADALAFPPPRESYKLIGNIPYNITSPLINHFLLEQFRKENGNPPRTITFVIQKEVAEKLAAKPPRMNVLALHTQPFAEIKKITTIRPGAFSPPPKVHSALVHCVIRETPLIAQKHIEQYLNLVHAAFSQKRKQLGATISEDLLEKNGIDRRKRPETLSIHDWGKLASTFL